MTLNQCTKEELIFIVRRLSGMDLGNEQYHINRLLNDVALMRQQKHLDEAEKWNQISTEKRREYFDILKQFDGKSIADAPADLLELAATLLRDADYADQKYDECIRRIDNG